MRFGWKIKRLALWNIKKIFFYKLHNCPSKYSPFFSMHLSRSNYLDHYCLPFNDDKKIIIVLQNVLSLFRIDFNHEYLLKIRNKDFRLKQLNDI